jgi:uncharacterized membrane protein
MLKRSDVEREIIAQIKAKGGRCDNAHALIVDELGRAWCHGYRTLCEIERRGLIVIERRGPFRSMTITLAGRHE